MSKLTERYKTEPSVGSRLYMFEFPDTEEELKHYSIVLWTIMFEHERLMRDSETTGQFEKTPQIKIQKYEGDGRGMKNPYTVGVCWKRKEEFITNG